VHFSEPYCSDWGQAWAGGGGPMLKRRCTLAHHSREREGRKESASTIQLYFV